MNLTKNFHEVKVKEITTNEITKQITNNEIKDIIEK